MKKREYEENVKELEYIKSIKDDLFAEISKEVLLTLTNFYFFI